VSRYARRVDASQPGMVEELRAHGVSCILTHVVGGDAPAFIAGRRGVTVLVECKTPGRERREKARLARQAEARAAWRGGPYVQATTAAEVLAALDAASLA
jgi:hypothetical protein